MGPRFLLLLCVAVTCTTGDGQTKTSDDGEKARLPEFLTELDLASLEASEEDVDALKKVVKRLAPTKNGEYQVYQGVMGQPGVDFPVLTSIPSTAFSCRGMKGGYYADLETNCQVFHICDNGRKISFLCPNGTIFQQSQLICDWWFKVDCGKSVELYEHSAEQLANDERKRAEARKMKSEFHRTSDSNKNQAHFQNQNVEYDGKQNGRMNPFGQTSAQEQDQNNQQNENSKDFGQSQPGARTANQFTDPQNPETQVNGRRNQYDQTYNQKQQRTQNINSFQTSNRQQSRFTESQHERTSNNYDSKNNYNQQVPNPNAQEYYGAAVNHNTQQEDKQSFRTGKSRNNFNSQPQRATPVYTETTTYRTTTESPIREYQQPAESAAFASSRGNRYNKAFNNNQFNNFYSNRFTGTEKYQSKATTFPSVNVRRGQAQNLPFPTFAPIYKPPTTTSTSYENTADRGTTTYKPYVNTDYYRQNTVTQTPYSSLYDTNAQDYQVSTNTPTMYTNTENYQQNSVTPLPYNEYYSPDAVNPSTQRPYVNTDTYRYENTEGSSTNSVTSGNQEQSTTQKIEAVTATTERPTGYYANTVTQRVNTERPYANNQNFDQQASTEKIFRFQQDAVTGKTLSPYDTSFTYRQGKVISTLGPYIPFTKNYAYTTTTTTTTVKPPAYTATVPTYVSTATGSRTNPQNANNDGIVSTMETPAYFPTKPAFETRPVPEQQHAINMLKSLQQLDGDAPSPVDGQNGSRVGLTIPASSGPSTIHSLALYFATASDDFDSNETGTDTAVSVKTRTGNDEGKTTTENDISAELPTTLLTQHTIKSYSELFNANAALGSNITTDNRLGEDKEKGLSDSDENNDLDLEQSQGPVTAARRSKDPKLRELAQVFTHALSAYLQDPDTFRKVLSEIRPTEPPSTSSNEITESTTFYPTTQEDYPSVTKEKDEVLDFSDVTKASKKRRPTTPYPTTTFDPSTFGQTDNPTNTNYYTTSVFPTESNYLTVTPMTEDKSSNDFAFAVNHAFRTAHSNDIRSDNSDLSSLSSPSGPNDYDSYYPTGNANIANRFGGFQNNTPSSIEPYGKHVKPFDATPISDNYVASSTPATYVQPSINSNSVQIIANGNPQEDLQPPQLRIIAENLVTAEPFNPEELNDLAASRISHDNQVDFTTKRHSGETNQESMTTNPESEGESLVTAGSVYPSYGNSYNDIQINFKSTEGPGTTSSTNFKTAFTTEQAATTMQSSESTLKFTSQPTDNHWTSSPAVTKLWETTVFVDPDHINQGLTTDSQVTGPTAFELPVTGITDYETTPDNRQETFATDASSGIISRNHITDPPSPWQWAPNNNDSPTAFTLLPQAYSTENTATPAPTYTTHSSIITTITSTVSTSANPTVQENRISENSNVMKKEIAKAQEMFGNLNATSTNTLMKVMKQADKNTTVRQLVLLLISHCNGPMNKTMEQEKEQLLNALLRMPVSDFSTEESREIIAGINKLQLPIGRVSSNSRSNTEPKGFASTKSPTVTTYRSREGRRSRTTTQVPVTLSRRSGKNAETSNSLVTEDESPSDTRALELLRSLYTIAAKWG